MNDDVLAEQAYLVSRGVRALALIGQCHGQGEDLFDIATRLEAAAQPGALPFMIPGPERTTSYGFAAASWVVDLVHWVTTRPVPEKHRQRILSLLAGYSVSGIRDMEESATPEWQSQLSTLA